MVSPGRLARMRRFFHRSNGGPSTATETVTDTQDGLGAQAAPHQDAAAASTGGGAQVQQEQAQAARTQNFEKLVAKPEPEPKPKRGPEPKAEPKLDPRPKPEPEPTPALAGQHVDAAVKEFGGVDPISGIATGAADAVGVVHTTISGIQTLGDTYLKPFKIFNQVVSALANVHPYAQAALGILTFTSRVPS
ncbi:hypothetical protein EDD16DRAFT_1673389 [Pisolithus croceorrhizus]|nr:hypothetical protein EDD16DRAFT_1673389 [Pisolithus croceorrhizus]